MLQEENYPAGGQADHNRQGQQGGGGGQRQAPAEFAHHGGQRGHAGKIEGYEEGKDQDLRRRHYPKYMRGSQQGSADHRICGPRPFRIASRERTYSPERIFC